MNLFAVHCQSGTENNVYCFSKEVNGRNTLFCAFGQYAKTLHATLII